jgi:molybdopterin molybdotransferase
MRADPGGRGIVPQGLRAAMLEVEDASSRVLSALPPPTPEGLPLHDAAARVLTDDVTSPIDVPPFDNSATDDYAARVAGEVWHVLSALAQADGLVDLPAAATLPCGSSVRVLRRGG